MNICKEDAYLKWKYWWIKNIDLRQNFEINMEISFHASALQIVLMAKDQKTEPNLLRQFYHFTTTQKSARFIWEQKCAHLHLTQCNHHRKVSVPMLDKIRWISSKANTVHLWRWNIYSRAHSDSGLDHCQFCSEILNLSIWQTAYRNI